MMVSDDLIPGEKIILVTSLPRLEVVNRTQKDLYPSCTDICRTS